MSAVMKCGQLTRTKCALATATIIPRPSEEYCEQCAVQHTKQVRRFSGVETVATIGASARGRWRALLLRLIVARFPVVDRSANFLLFRIRSLVRSHKTCSAHRLEKVVWIASTPSPQMATTVKYRWTPADDNTNARKASP